MCTERIYQGKKKTQTMQVQRLGAWLNGGVLALPVNKHLKISYRMKDQLIKLQKQS